MNITTNKKAFFDYEIVEQFEAGIVLKGTEVKSIRANLVNLKEAHIKIMNEEMYLINSHVSPYAQGNIENHDPRRTRKLLLHGKEIKYLNGKVQEKGLTLVPLKMYLKNRKIKISIALARGKKLHDKRQSMREKDLNREAHRALKER